LHDIELPSRRVFLINIIVFLPLDALYEDLSRSSFVAKTAVHDFKQTYATITNEFREQRDQLLQRLYHVKKDIKR